MSAQDWTVCTEHDQLAEITWDGHVHASTDGPVRHGVARCLIRGCWWNVWRNAPIALEEA